MQALESLNDSQVNDFLSGKSPLNLSVRLGDHMMLIQLQLSTINPTTTLTQQQQTTQSPQSINTSSNTSGSSSTKSSRSSGTHRPTHPIPTVHQQHYQHSTSSSSSAAVAAIAASSTPQSSFSIIDPVPSTSKVHHVTTESPIPRKSSDMPIATTSPYNSSKTRSPTDNNVHNDLNSYLMKQDVENLESIVKSLSNILDEDDTKRTKLLSNVCLSDSESYPDAILEQSPIKSLSNLVCSSMSEATAGSTATAKNNSTPAKLVPPTSPLDCSDPISANLTSCLCKRLDTNSNGCESHCNSSTTSSSPVGNTISKPEQIVPNFGFPTSTPPIAAPPSTGSTRTTGLYHHHRNMLTTPIMKPRSRHSLRRHHSASSVLSFNENSSSSLDSAMTSSTSILPDNIDTNSEPPLTPPPLTTTNTVENPTLAEASRNLTQTLRKLSKKVFPRGDGSRRIASGAVIESMKHHGKGIYSGTFSGTLNPALQDKHGRPKRDISTIIHILNDLLSAAPHCARNGAKIYFEPTTQGQSAGTSSSSNTTGTTTSAINVTAQPSGLKSLRQVSRLINLPLKEGSN